MSSRFQRRSHPLSRHSSDRVLSGMLRSIFRIVRRVVVQVNGPGFGLLLQDPARSGNNHAAVKLEWLVSTARDRTINFVKLRFGVFTLCFHQPTLLLLGAAYTKSGGLNSLVLPDNTRSLSRPGRPAAMTHRAASCLKPDQHNNLTQTPTDLCPDSAGLNVGASWALMRQCALFIARPARCRGE